MAQYARGSAVAVIRLRNPPVNALRYRRQPAGSAGLGPPCERVGDSPSASLSPSSLSPSPAEAPSSPGAGRPLRASAGTSTALSARRAPPAPSEVAWISLCKQHAELCRNFCSFLQFLVGEFHRRGARLSKLYFPPSPPEGV